MRVVAAYLLAVLGGNQHPDAAAINAILSSVGIEADKAQVTQLLDALKGKNINDVIKEGNTKLASLPSGGAAPASTAAPAKAEEKKDDKKGAKKEEKAAPVEEPEVDMGLR